MTSEHNSIKTRRDQVNAGKEGSVLDVKHNGHKDLSIIYLQMRKKRYCGMDEREQSGV